MEGEVAVMERDTEEEEEVIMVTEEEVIMEGIMEAVEERLGLRVGQVTVMEGSMSMVLEE